MVNVSVVICTYNRAESLRDTLVSLVSQTVNGNPPYEIIVVDNNSKDRTKEVVQEFQAHNGRFVRYIFEGRQGLAYARNTGIRAAKGEIVAYVDDDVIVDPAWLEALWKCFRDTNADAVGGRILRKWYSEQPVWYSEKVGGCLVHQDLGILRKDWNSERQHFVTANIAFRRDVFDRFGIFREELGRRGDELVGGEDRELYQRLIRGDSHVVYEPEALAYHKVEPERLTKKYFRRWFWDVGRTLGHEMERKWYHVMTIAPFWIWKDLFQTLIRFLRVELYPGSNARERFAAGIWILHYFAMLRERFFHWLPFGLGNRWCAHQIKGGI